MSLRYECECGKELKEKGRLTLKKRTTVIFKSCQKCLKKTKEGKKK